MFQRSDDITLGLRPWVISYLVAGLYNAYRPLKHVISDRFIPWIVLQEIVIESVRNRCRVSQG